VLPIEICVTLFKTTKIMAFTNFKNIKAVKDKYPHIIVRTGNLIPMDLPEIKVNPYLQEEILLNLETYRSNEFYASETLVSPVLREAWKPFRKKMNLWTHQAIRFNEELSGVPDYMFTYLDQEQYEILSYPLLTTVEAKAENFEEGWGQCLAQMIAFREINQMPDMTIFGIVTTGKFWEFGKLEGNTLLKNALVYILQETQKQILIFKEKPTPNL
jgi:hypothetical protein